MIALSWDCLHHQGPHTDSLITLFFFCVVGGRFWLGADGGPVMDVVLPAPTVNLHQIKLGICPHRDHPVGASPATNTVP